MRVPLFLLPVLVAVSLVAVSLTRPVRAEDPIRFAIGEWPPYVTELDLGYGTHAKLVTAVFERAGLSVEYDFMPWKRAYDVARAGTHDGTFPWAPTAERRQHFLFSDTPLERDPTVAFYLKRRFPNGIAEGSLDQLIARGFSFVAINGYLAEEMLLQREARVHQVSSSQLAWRVLERGRVDLFLESEPVGQREVLEHLGPEAPARFGRTGPVFHLEYFLLLSRNSPRAERLKAIWERHAPAIIAAQRR